MSLESALSIAAGSLANVNRGLAVVSQNVANANTAGYVREVANQESVTAAGQGMGVRSLPVTRAINTELQSDLFLQNATVAGLQVRQAALQAIDTVQGTVGSGADLSSLVGNLQDAFSSLGTSPDDTVRQTGVVTAATRLARQLNALSEAVTGQRQTAQNSIVDEVGTLNTALTSIGTISDQIMQLKAQGLSTADLENQRDAQMGTVSGLLSVRFQAQSNGDMLVMTTSGLMLPTRGGDALSTSAANIGANATYPGGIPAITLAGTDVTTQLSGGQIGANIALRDTTLPTDQAQLDEFAETLTTRFDAQGLTLFTDANGSVPVASGPPAQAGYVGYAGTIQVNATVAATPSLVRDGTHAVAGSATGASAFIPNTAAGPSGFQTMINRVLDYSFDDDVQEGVAQAAPATAGLGPLGTLSAGFAAPGDLAGFAVSVVGTQARTSAAASDSLTTEQAVATGLQTKLAATSAVSIDDEMTRMVQLQNLYGATAKIITSAQTMWNQTLDMVRA